MKLVRPGLIAASVAVLLGLAACHRTHDLTDAQLTALLHTEDSQVSDPKAPLEPRAVNCLRAWSGDADVAKGLSAQVMSDNEKTACRKLVDLWIADKTRNADGARFEDVTQPATVRRAMRVLAEHSTSVARVPATHADAAAPRVAPRLTGTQPAPPESSVAAAAALSDLDDVCKQMKKQKSTGKVNTMQSRYADTCDARIQQLRTRYADLSQNGESTEAALFARQVQNYASMAQKMVSGNVPRSPNN